MPQTTDSAPTRDKLTTVRADGSRVFLRPADVSGRWTLWRRIAAVALIAAYAALPFIQINGAPAVFFDVAGTRLHLFGLAFSGRDMWMLFFVVSGLAFSLFFVTALFGRLWCGWACPQTVFLEHLFRRIERLIDGPSRKARKDDAAFWTPRVFWKRAAKHAIFFLMSFVIAHIFMSYFLSPERLFAWMGESPLKHPKAFAFTLFVSFALYFNFAWFREQFCIILCPYGRLQSALIDEHSVNIGYDEKRGEPRGKAADPKAGDCVDCGRCVAVCPTGIDIRQGLQLECVACANCIDACDAIMERLDRPKGLIRYDSQIGFDGGKARLVRPRTILYSILFVVGVSLFALSLSTLRSFDVVPLRMRGSPYYVQDGHVRNQYFIRFINKRNEPVSFSVSLHPEGRPDAPIEVREGVALEPLEEAVLPFVARMSVEEYEGPFTLVALTVDGSGASLERSIEFLGPPARLLKEKIANEKTARE